MADIFGVAKHTTIQSVISFSYTCSHGISPGVASLTTADISAVDSGGDVVDIEVTDGTRKFKLRDCHPIDCTTQAGPDGAQYTIHFFDRRWRWEFGRISGTYNQRDADGKIIPGTKASPRVLATKLLDAMKEGTTDVGAIPSEVSDLAMPSIDWQEDNPAKALAAMCDLYGLRVVYQPITNKIILAQPGDGKLIPGEPSPVNDSPTYTFPLRPERMSVAGGPAALLMAVRLEAVGLELDGSIQPIDDLSYKPANGWTAGDAVDNPVLPDKYAAKGKTRKDCLDAARTVFCYYRVTPWAFQEGGEFKAPGLDDMMSEGRKPPKVVTYDQIVPLDRIYGTDRDEKSRLYFDPPQLYGSAAIGFPLPGLAGIAAGAAVAGWAGNTPIGFRFPDRLFTIDTPRGLVIFNGRVKRSNTVGIAQIADTLPTPPGKQKAFIPRNGQGPAELVLVTSCLLRDPDTRAPIRFYRDKIIGGPGDVKMFRRDEIQFVTAGRVKTADWTFEDFTHNGTECAAAADVILEKENTYDLQEAQTVTVPRIVLLDPDGAIQQVTWDVGGGTYTRISRNTEHSKVLQPYEYKRGLEKIRYDVARAAVAGPGALAIEVNKIGKRITGVGP